MSNQESPSRESSFLERYGRFRLRRVKPISTDLLQEYSHHSEPGPRDSPSSTDSGAGLTPRHLLRIWLRPPWDDYVGGGLPEDQTDFCSTAEPVLACRRGTYFRKASIRTFRSSGGVKLLQVLSNIQHPNIATLYDIYLHQDMIFFASEHLSLSLSDIDFRTFPCEEWEIATVVCEVWALLVEMLGR